MCDIADRIRREGMEKGIKEGIKEGITESLKNLIKNANMTLEQAMAVLEVPEEDRLTYAGKVGQ